MKMKLNENEIIKNNERLVLYVLRKYRYRPDYEDLVQEGRIALLNAYRAFNPKIKEYDNWGSFAAKCISQRIYSIIHYHERRQKRYCKYDMISLNSHVDDMEWMEIQDCIPDSKIDIEIEVLNKIEFEAALSKLTNDRQRKVFIERYMGMTLRDIGQTIDVSAEWVRQLLLKIKKILIEEEEL